MIYSKTLGVFGWRCRLWTGQGRLQRGFAHALLAVSLAGGACTAAAQDGAAETAAPETVAPETAAEDAAPAAVITRYRVDITGAPAHVYDLLKQISQLHQLKNKPPATVAALRRRIADDEDRFRAALESEGYYDARLETSLHQNKGVVEVGIAIVPGERFKVRSLSVRLDRDVAAAPGLAARPFETPLNAIAGKPARAADVIAAEEHAIAILRDQGYPFARRSDRETDVEHETHTIAVVLPVNTGPYVLFGDTHVSGLKKVHDAYMQRVVPWRTGTPFVFSALDALRKDYIYTGLFSSVAVAPRDTRDVADNTPLDIDVTVAEGARRSVSLAGKYGRDTGFGGTATWTHRNLFGNAEKLETRLDGTQLEQTTSAAFTKPDFLRRGQALKLNAELKRSDTNAFTGYSGTLYAGLERRIGRDWIVGAGISFDGADLSQNGASDRSYLVGLPVTVTRAPSIALNAAPEAFVDQAEGWRMRLTTTPYAGSFAASVAFLKSEAEGDVYIPLDQSLRYVFAARLKLGTILGANNTRIPADKRFYAGGGGSVRGFGYQLISPLDAAGTPTGGRSLIEAGIETRIKLTDTIGIVPFVDIGAVSRTSLPGQNARVAAGAGIGGRYYTAVGPLRLDFALPLNPRGGVDKGFQFYVSFGQAF